MRQEEVGEPPETESMQRCVFCGIEPDPGSVVLQSDHFSITKDKFPVSPGHLLIIPRRHITSPSDLSETEWANLYMVLEEACSILRNEDDTITGFNIGMNIGSDAGQTIPHLHVHVIPRRPGDIPESKCGVRMVNPAKADYRVTDYATKIPK
jgi:diadenosine tetraphosphate (Ap4A) HIT family hydrolase